MTQHPDSTRCDDCGRGLTTIEEMEIGICAECQHLDADEDKMLDDAAWQSEARLRDMEGVGDYEGPRNWP